MYSDTRTSNKLGKFSAELLNLLTELGSRRSKDSERVYIRPADYAQYVALKQFLGAE
jgi:hypothetical protein